MNPTMSRNIFGVIWKFWKNSIFWVILESLLQLKRILDHFKSWNYPFLCVWWGTKSFELIKVPEVCFPGGALSAPPHVKYTKQVQKLDIDASMQYFSHYFWDMDVFLKYLEILQYFFNIDRSLTHLAIEMLIHLKINLVYSVVRCKCERQKFCLRMQYSVVCIILCQNVSVAVKPLIHLHWRIFPSLTSACHLLCHVWILTMPTHCGMTNSSSGLWLWGLLDF